MLAQVANRAGAVAGAVTATVGTIQAEIVRMSGLIGSISRDARAA